MRRIKTEAISGLLLLDKPAGLTSHQAVTKVREALRAQTAGHTGTLDPLATGMLPIAFGLATRLAGWMLDADKAYRVRAQLGIVTDTLDAAGKIIETRAVPTDWLARLPAALQPLRGRILQTPPQFSALKRDGAPLYKLARAGVEVQLQPREVRVERIELLAHGADWLELEIQCGKGTYIRSLVDDLGDALGCGAHVAALHRLWVDPFVNAPMLSLEQIRGDRDGTLAGLRPAQQMIPQLPAIEVSTMIAERLLHGQRIPGYRSHAGQPNVAVNCASRLIGIVEVDAHGVLRPLRILTL